MPPTTAVKPIAIVRWIVETRIYPGGKVVQKVFPTRGATAGYAKKKNVGDQIDFAKEDGVDDL